MYVCIYIYIYIYIYILAVHGPRPQGIVIMLFCLASFVDSIWMTQFIKLNFGFLTHACGSRAPGRPLPAAPPPRIIYGIYDNIL